MLHAELKNDFLCFSKDMRGVYLNVNPGFIFEAGISNADDALGKNDKALPWGAYSDIFRTSDMRVIDSEKSHMFLEHFIVKGVPRLHRSFKSPLLGTSGKIIGVTGLSVPINPATLISLTRQQTACLKHLALGFTFKQIAQTLGLSPKTVEHYLDNVKIKLNCQSRPELILQAIERGLINFL